MADVKAFDFLDNKCILTNIKKYVNLTMYKLFNIKNCRFFSKQQVQYNLFNSYIPRISFIALTTYAILNSIKSYLYTVFHENVYY